MRPASAGLRTGRVSAWRPGLGQRAELGQHGQVLHDLHGWRRRCLHLRVGCGFTTFINRYNSSSLLGIDFDIEGGQSQDVINNLVQRVVAAQRSFPNLRFSFTIATLGGNSPNSLNHAGCLGHQAIKPFGLTKYTINLMAMDYGSTTPGNCTVVGGSCDMAQSAIAAAENLHSFYGTPYANIELTPMIGGNDTQSEVFTHSERDGVSAYAAQKGLAGIHYWSFDRDNDCRPGSASPTCNSYGRRAGWVSPPVS